MPAYVSLLLFVMVLFFSERFNHHPLPSSRSPASLNISAAEQEGRLLIEADDTDPNQRNHKLNYYVEDAQKKLHRVEKPTKSLTEAIQPLREEREPLVREHKMLILLFKFNNSASTFTTSDEVQNAVFNGAFQNFFREISDQKEVHTGRVYGFYHLNRNGEDDGGSSMPCNVSPLEIKEAAAHYQINLSEYAQVTTVSNCSEYFTVGGMASLGPYDFLEIGKPQNYIKMAIKPELFQFNEPHPYVPGWGGFISILVHERGHNFGLLHSNALDCLDSPILHPCTSIEYGNTFDRMGGPDGSNLFNAHQQFRAGWKRSEEFLHIRNSGYYRIDKLTSKRKKRKIGAYIYNPKNPDQKLFMLEYRIPEGMDNNLSNWVFRNVKFGAHLYTTIGTSSLNQSPTIGSEFRIVDPHPTQLDWHQDTAYESLQGEYLDVRSGIRIITYSPNPDSIEFRVVYDPNASVCGKTALPDWTGKPYLKRYQDTPTSTQDSSLRNPSNGGVGDFVGHGDNSNPGSLPPYSLEIKNGPFVLVPGDYFNLKIDTLIGDPMICDRAQLEIQLLSPSEIQSYFTGVLTSNSFKKITRNIDQKLEFPVLKVPVTELNRNRKLRFQIKNRVTGETMIREMMLYIRKSHQTLVSPEANQSNTSEQ